MLPRLLIIIVFLFPLFILSSTVTFAVSQDIKVNCFGSNDIDDCVITPSNGKLFDEHNVLPGDTFVQYIDVTNITLQSLNAFWDINSDALPTTSSLAEVITLEIKKDTPDGETVMSARPLSEVLKSSTFIPLSQVMPNQSQSYAVIASMDRDVGNEYQVMSSEFDVLVHMELSTDPLPSPTSTPTPLVTPQNNLWTDRFQAVLQRILQRLL